MNNSEQESVLSSKIEVIQDYFGDEVTGVWDVRIVTEKTHDSSTLDLTERDLKRDALLKKQYKEEFAKRLKEKAFTGYDFEAVSTDDIDQLLEKMKK